MSKGNLRGLILRTGLVVMALMLSAAAVEIALRLADGLPLSTITLPLPGPERGRQDARTTADGRHVPAIPLAAGVDPAWYALDPPPRMDSTPWTPDTAAREARYRLTDPLGAFFVWNRAYLTRELCAGSTVGSLGVLDDFYVFDPPDGKEYPIYRHLPYVHAAQWFVPNRFGWRGPDVTVTKPPNTIRIAFLGASTTIGSYHFRFVHTELLAHWLNLWMAGRGGYGIEVMNLARTGVDVHSTAAVVEQELLPLEPDLAIYYEGANSFRPGQMMNLPRDLAFPTARPNVVLKWRSEYYSAAARLLRPLVDTWLSDDGAEPEKAVFDIVWPPQVDEFDPDVTQPSLPMTMETVVAKLDRMRRALHGTGGRLALASFVWLVEDGLRLELPRDLTLFNYLNTTYYPLAYAQLRRTADFQNRVFRNFTRVYDLPFLDVDAQMPRDPLLFIDAIHMTERGLRLQAWIYLQLLVPWLDAEIAAGRLPRLAREPRTTHPGIVPEAYKIVSRAALTAGCP